MTIKRVSRVLDGKLDTNNTPSSPYKPQVTEVFVPESVKPRGQAYDLSVDLSAAAKLRSKKGMYRSMQDIQDSGLPDDFKELLIAQRDSKQKIIRKISELQKVKHNTQLRADLRKQRILMIQTEIMALEASYVQAIDKLDSLMSQTEVSDEQADRVALLLMS